MEPRFDLLEKLIAPLAEQRVESQAKDRRLEQRFRWSYRQRYPKVVPAKPGVVVLEGEHDGIAREGFADSLFVEPSKLTLFHRR